MQIFTDQDIIPIENGGTGVTTVQGIVDTLQFSNPNLIDILSIREVKRNIQM